MHRIVDPKTVGASPIYGVIFSSLWIVTVANLIVYEKAGVQLSAGWPIFSFMNARKVYINQAGSAGANPAK